VPFKLVHAGKYATEDKLKTYTTKTKHSLKKQTTQNTAEQNYPAKLPSSHGTYNTLAQLSA